jgi:hypothetical protein
VAAAHALPADVQMCVQQQREYQQQQQQQAALWSSLPVPSSSISSTPSSSSSPSVLSSHHYLRVYLDENSLLAARMYSIFDVLKLGALTFLEFALVYMIYISHMYCFCFAI